MDYQLQTLEEQRLDFSQRRFLAMPMAGAIAWTIIGGCSIFFNDSIKVWVLFIATGSIVYLGMLISKYTGENFLAKDKPKNTFDNLFLISTSMALVVYSIAIPFFLIDYTSLPLSVGILTGLMWMPFSWIVHHWVGIFHTLVRTLVIVIFWYLFPENRFVIIPFSIVFIYGVTIFILEYRFRRMQMTLTQGD